MNKDKIIKNFETFEQLKLVHGPEFYHLLEPKEKVQAVLYDNAKDVFNKINLQNDKDFTIAEDYFKKHYTNIDWEGDADLFDKILKLQEKKKH